MDDLTKMIIGAAVAYLVPKLLDPLVKGGEGGGGFAWLPWLLGHAAAGAAGGVAVGGLAAQGLGAIGGGVANWATFGLLLGLAQWLVLQRGGRLSPLWVVGSLLGWSSCAWAQAMAVPGPLVWNLAGLLAGLLQWPILARPAATPSGGSRPARRGRCWAARSASARDGRWGNRGWASSAPGSSAGRSSQEQ